MAEVFVFSIILLVGIFIGVQLVSVTPEEIAKATKVCSTNEGLKLIYPDGDFHCNNGVKGSVE